MNTYLNNSDHPMVSLDFSCMHLRWAYHLMMLVPDGDLYSIEGFDRGLIKYVCNISLNCKKSKGRNPYDGAIKAIKKHVKGYGQLAYNDAKNALYALLKKHPDVTGSIASDFGIKAMYYDSLIMEDCIRELMVKKGIVVCPVHDELLCPAGKIDGKSIPDIVENQMIKSYRKILKQALVKNKKLTISDPLPVELVPTITRSD